MNASGIPNVLHLSERRNPDSNPSSYSTFCSIEDNYRSNPSANRHQPRGIEPSRIEGGLKSTDAVRHPIAGRAESSHHEILYRRAMYSRELTSVAPG